MRAILRHVVRRIRSRWPDLRILVRGDSHYAWPDALDWCEDNGIGYLFELVGNDVLRARVRPAAENAWVHRAEAGADELCGFDAFDYAAKSWRRSRDPFKGGTPPYGRCKRLLIPRA